MYFYGVSLVSAGIPVPPLPHVPGFVTLRPGAGPEPWPTAASQGSALA